MKTGEKQTGNPQTNTIQLKKGEALFQEGDTSQSMYLLQRGVVRIFKKKGQSRIELDTIHSGQVIGELAFLDGNPRSASAEALTNCELVEISSETFIQTFANMPHWVKVLLKTIVSRMRSASTRIRQLEAGSTINYSSKQVGQTPDFVNWNTFLKTGLAIIFVALRSKNHEDRSVEVSFPETEKYAHLFMSVPKAKITSILEMLNEKEIIQMDEETRGKKFTLNDLAFFQDFMDFLHEQNQTDSMKQKVLSKKGFLIMTLISKNLDRYSINPETGRVRINLTELHQEASSRAGKEVFKIEDCQELVRLGFIDSYQGDKEENKWTELDRDEYLKQFAYQKLLKGMENLNKSKGAGDETEEEAA